MIIKPLTDRKWNGYTLEQLQDEKLLNDARIDIQKMRLKKKLQSFGNNVGGGKGVTKKIFSALDYVDYIVLGMVILRKLKPLLSIFRKKR